MLRCCCCCGRQRPGAPYLRENCGKDTDTKHPIITMMTTCNHRFIPLMVAITLTALLSSPANANHITLTPYCDNSIRVTITPPNLNATDIARFTTVSNAGALVTNCGPGRPTTATGVTNGNLEALVGPDGSIEFRRTDTGALLIKTEAVTFVSSTKYPGYYAADLVLSPQDSDERIYGLGQGNWTTQGGAAGGCATGDPQRVVPLERNGQTVDLLQRKFHVSIPFAYSTGGYGFLWNQPGYGQVVVGERGKGGMTWSGSAVLGLDFWVTASSSSSSSSATHPSIYQQYADATGHAPLLREDAMIFWQSRNRYKTTEIALSVAERYASLDLPVGVFVIDFHNQHLDGDFQPDPRCYPSVANLTHRITKSLNASTVFSFWPEALSGSKEYDLLHAKGCLINPDLGGLAIDATKQTCRELIWSEFLKPRYYDQGVYAYWLDETDGEGTGTGDGDHGYDTSYGPAFYASNLWVNHWISMFNSPVIELGEHAPLVLARGVWAGGQRYGVVLWSSDIESTFEELTAQVPLGVHASLSGIPWWTSDVGGYGCGSEQPNNTTYMQELIVRWYQFGCFCPVFRTHGCRKGEANPEPKNASYPCEMDAKSCGENEVWSYGPSTQVMLEKYIRLRHALKPYIQNLAENVTSRGVPTMRPLWYEFPDDEGAIGINDQFMLGPDLLVAPVTVQNATQRSVYFPGTSTPSGGGDEWVNLFNHSVVVKGGQRVMVDAPLELIPVYWRGGRERVLGLE